MFNKVMTAQYFLWWISFWPLILINNRLASKDQVWKFGLCVVIVATVQAFWGYYANAFENGGENTLLEIQATNFVFLVANMGCCLFMLKN